MDLNCTLWPQPHLCLTFMANNDVCSVKHFSVSGAMAGYVVSGRDVTFLTGDTAVMKCSITKMNGTSDGELHYFWERDGAVIYFDSESIGTHDRYSEFPRTVEFDELM